MEAPKIVTLEPKNLIGKRIQMSLANNKTTQRWQGFMPHKKLVTNSIGTDLYSLQVYDVNLDFKDFNPTVEFEKWALIEVANFQEVPSEMETLQLQGGLYAIFLHKGLPSEFAKTFNHIFAKWLPSSNYVIDNRPHFEVLGKKYSNTDPNSEEEVWIPIKLK